MRSFTVLFQRDVVEEQTIDVQAENIVDAIKKAKEKLVEASWDSVDFQAPRAASCVET